MIVALNQPLVTADEFERMSDTKGCELIDGRIVEMPQMGMEATWVTGQAFLAVETHCRRHRLGWVLTSQAEYNCFPDRPNHIRKADVSFIRFGRLEDERL